ncbi:MAG TPA: phosphatase PAP2 family protein [Parafilimonas sp.]
MKYFISCCIVMSIFLNNTKAQDSTTNSNSVQDTTAPAPSIKKDSVANSTAQMPAAPNNTSPGSKISSSTFDAKNVYHISWKVDAPVTGVGLGLSVLGLHFIQNKDSLTAAEANAKSRSDVPAFDRGNAGFYSDKDNNASYIPFFTSFAMPLVFVVADKTEREQAGQIIVMYTESLAITSALFTISAGAVQRSRPLVYPDKNGNFKAPLDKRESNNSQRSFYAGHTAAAASATFFAAKVFSDLHPDSKLKPYVWIVSAAIPAVTAYYRYESGEHFLSDNILGYVIGAASGILVPELHKNKNFNDHVTISPALWQDAKGVSIVYSFK